MSALSSELTMHIPALMRAARAITRSLDLAEDLAQEALLRVWAKLKDGEQIDDLRPYLLTTLRNLARRPARLAPVEAAGPETTDGAAADRVALNEVMSALKNLPHEQSELLRRAAFWEDTMAEISEETGIPCGTVASRISRARARLKEELHLPPTAALTELLDH